MLPGLSGKSRWRYGEPIVGKGAQSSRRRRQKPTFWKTRPRRVDADAPLLVKLRELHQEATGRPVEDEGSG